MPFTPFHLGPGAAIKVFAQGYFSFIVFGFTQIIIDLESLYYLLQGELYIHRFMHSYLGATLVLIFTIFIGKYICELFIRIWNSVLNPKQSHWFHITPKIPKVALYSGAIIGVYSHVLLDSVMHSDIKPFQPFFDTNSLLGAITIAELHMFCLATGIFGIVSLLAIFVWNKFTYEI